ncbi:MAG: protein kinase [Proteobacteria bacterium]|nr:protein kinase [Pseudomonadota bacterium]
MRKPIPFGKYYLLDRISVGGMAEVFKAKALGVEGFERLIAVKRILPSIAEDEEFITMFIDEAKISVQLQHANIAQIFDLGKVGESYFIAMEYVSGRDMRTIYDKMGKKQKTVPIPMAVYLAMKVCEGLDYAHNKKDSTSRDLNLVHRDVSPQNILVSYDGEVKVIDFGIAKAAGKAGKTQAGILKGKFGYMSPEQVRGLPLDRRSDIFAVGICFWEMLTGQRLFIGESDFATLEKVRNVEITSPSNYNPSLPDELERITLKALQKDVDDRYQSAMDLHDDLQNWMYTSGSFFARKDLNAFMQQLFRKEIDREIASMGGPGGISSSFPPPSRPRTGSRSMGRTPRAQSIPPPSSAGKARLGVTITPPLPPSAQRKRTELGMAAPNMPPGVAPGAPNNVPLNLVGGDVAGRTPPNLRAGVPMDDWDDDEPATNLYSKETAQDLAQMAVGATPRVGTVQPGGVLPMPADGTTPVDLAEERPAYSAAQRASGTKSALMIGGIAAVVIIAVLAAILIVRANARPGGGSLMLDVTPADKLTVTVDGNEVLTTSTSPLVLSELSPGEHEVLVQREGYREFPFTVNMTDDEALRRIVSMDKVTTGFFLETEPLGAEVQIDDQKLEDVTPVTVDNMVPGKYTVRIIKGDLYLPKVIEVMVVEGEIRKLPVKKLDFKKVEVTFVTKPDGVTVSLISKKGRETLGVTPLAKEINNEKRYKIRYSKSGYVDVVRSLEVAPGNSKVTLATVALWEEGSSGPGRQTSGTQSPTDALPEGVGTLSVQTRPWSKVYINGKFIKNTPLVKHRLKAGVYRVTVEDTTNNVKKDFRATIKAGQSTTLVKRLM